MKSTSGDVPSRDFWCSGAKEKGGVFTEGTRAVCFLSHQGRCLIFNTGWGCVSVAAASHPTNDQRGDVAGREAHCPRQLSRTSVCLGITPQRPRCDVDVLKVESRRNDSKQPRHENALSDLPKKSGVTFHSPLTESVVG